MRPASRTGSRPFTSSTPMLSRPTLGRSRSNSTRAMALPITAMVDEMLGIGADRGAEIEHNRLAPQRRPQRRDRRPLDAVQRLEVEARHRHQRAGVAGGDGDIGLATLDRIDGEPHRRFPAAVAERLARLVIHADGHVGVHQCRGGLEPSDATPAAARSWRGRRKAGIRCRDGASSARSAPGTTIEGPWSPPMASSAMRTFCGMDRSRRRRLSPEVSVFSQATGCCRQYPAPGRHTRG